MEDPNETPEAVRERLTASIEVQHQYLSQITELRGKLKTAEAQARGSAEWQSKARALEEELDMYRALVKGWPKGRKLVKRLTRDPYDY